MRLFRRFATARPSAAAALASAVAALAFAAATLALGCSTPVDVTEPSPSASPTEPEVPLPIGAEPAPGPDTPAPTPSPDAGPSTNEPAPSPSADGGSTPGPDTREPDAGPTPTPTPPPVANCGDNQASGDELCDGTDLAGLSCRSVGFASGNVTCKQSCQDVDSASCTPLTATPIAASGASIPLSGSLDATDPTWSRPSSTCTAGSTAGHLFDAYAIVNNTGVAQTVSIVADWGTGDGFLHVFGTPFDPRTVTSCRLGNDDSGGTSASALNAVPISAGETLVVVASAFDPATPFGPYSITVGTDTAAPGATCPNGVVEAGEACDGTAFDGDSCVARGFDRGDLNCSADCLTISETGCINDPPPPPTPIAAPGQAVQSTGTIVAADAKWNRPDVTCTVTAGTADKLFDTLQIVNQTGSAQTVTITANWAANADGILFVYKTPFTPSDPATNCVAGNDDLTGPTISQLQNVAIAPDEVLVVVVSALAALTPIGDYALNVATDEQAQCGNNLVQTGEICDGTDLAGDSCSARGLNTGALSCLADCTGFDPVGCYAQSGPLQIAAAGGVVSTVGALSANDGLFDRPFSSCSLSGGAADHFFDAIEIHNSTGLDQTVNVTATWTGGDGFLHAYSAFNPATPNTGCIKGNDDFGDRTKSQLAGLPIGAGQSLFITATTFTGGDTITSYSLDVETLVVANCGDALVQGDEICEAGVLGAQTCASQGFFGGTLGCATDCFSFDTSGCYDLGGPDTIAQQGGVVVLSGSLDVTDPQWERPLASCLASPGNLHYFDGHVIRNDTGFPQTLTLTANWTGGDGFLHVYSSAFDPSSPTTGCLDGDDDFGGSGASQIVSVAIAPGEELTVVASAFSADDAIGAYTIDVLTDVPDAIDIADVGLTVQVSGTLDVADPVFDRPKYDCTDSSIDGQRFDAFRIRNTTGSAQILTLTGRWAGDGYLIVMDDTFDPAISSTWTSACLKTDDDYAASTAGTARNGSQISRISLPAGQSRWVVATTFDGAATIGDYTVDILTDVATGDAFAQLSSGASLLTSGTLNAISPQFKPPVFTATTCGAAGAVLPDNHFFEVLRIENPTAATMNIDITAVWGSGNGFLYLEGYDSANTPSTTGSCWAHNDDDGGTSQSRILDSILPGEKLVVVATTATAGASIGPFLIEVKDVTP